MGFGILFLGYFATTMMSIPLSRMLPVDLGGFIKLFGYILIIIAAKKLSDYNGGFMKLIPSTCLMALISAFEGFLDRLPDLDMYTHKYTHIHTHIYNDNISYFYGIL